MMSHCPTGFICCSASISSFKTEVNWWDVTGGGLSCDSCVMCACACVFKCSRDRSPTALQGSLSKKIPMRAHCTLVSLRHQRNNTHGTTNARSAGRFIRKYCGGDGRTCATHHVTPHRSMRSISSKQVSLSGKLFIGFTGAVSE